MKATRFKACTVLIIATLGIGGCAGNGNPGVEADSSSGGSSGDTVIVPPSFNVSVSFQSLNYLHDSVPADWSKDCSVPPTASTSATKYITCLLEAHELDLYSRDLKLSVKAPQSQCAYLALAPYWFWRYRAGMGPTSLTITEDQSVTPTTYAISAIQRAASNASAVTATNLNAAPVCSTDYRQNGGPNCCSGFYLKTYRLIPSGGGPPTTTMSMESWGGEIGNCAAGPGAEIAAVDQDAAGWGRGPGNVPIPKLIPANAETQTATWSYTIRKPIELLNATSVYRANYFPMTASPVPDSLASGAYDAASSAHQTYPQPYHEFFCLDAGSEIKARIRLQIRKWNLVSELQQKSGGSWNDSGPENTDPAYPGADMNDYPGWEDIPGYLNGSF